MRGGRGGKAAGERRIEGTESVRLAGALGQAEQRGQRDGQVDVRGQPRRAVLVPGASLTVPLTSARAVPGAHTPAVPGAC